MPDEALPPQVVDFLARNIATVEELEILLLLAKEAGKSWRVEEIYQVIKSTRQSVEHGLAKFAAAGLVVRSGADFSIASLQPHVPLPELIQCYREMPVRVIQTIYQPSRDSIQDFADAFKLRRDP
ncbi:MAG: hypothetical protein EOP84_08580 [Verrucomicrobiaceae bacterium]|nr:MAG: hypothetical protein EOP84_08580 [Verrucomicrobiaceae bacterium]